MGRPNLDDEWLSWLELQQWPTAIVPTVKLGLVLEHFIVGQFIVATKGSLLRLVFHFGELELLLPFALSEWPAQLEAHQFPT